MKNIITIDRDVLIMAIIESKQTLTIDWEVNQIHDLVESRTYNIQEYLIKYIKAGREALRR